MVMDKEEKLARVINPDAWAFYDKTPTEYRSAVEAVVDSSREVAARIVDSGLMASEEWDTAEYLRARERIKNSTSRTGKCIGVEDLLDGYTKHTTECRYWPDGGISGTGCIR